MKQTPVVMSPHHLKWGSLPTRSWAKPHKRKRWSQPRGWGENMWPLNARPLSWSENPELVMFSLNMIWMVPFLSNYAIWTHAQVWRFSFRNKDRGTRNTQQACSGHPRNKMVWTGFTWLTCLSPNKSKIQPSSKQLINSKVPEKVLHQVHMEHENHVAHLSLAHSIGCWETVLQLPTSAMSNSPGIRKWKKNRQKRWPPLQIPNGLSAN